MKISEPATAAQERALPRALSAWSLGYACLILMVLVSRQADAQTTIDVTLQPGEFSKTIQAPGTARFTVRYRTPMYLCSWPTIDQLKSVIQSAASRGQLEQWLNQMENIGTDLGNYSGSAFQALWGWNDAFSGADQEFTQQQVAAGPFTYTFRNRCLRFEEARTVFSQIRDVIRSYLGLPASVGSPAQNLGLPEKPPPLRLTP